MKSIDESNNLLLLFMLVSWCGAHCSEGLNLKVKRARSGMLQCLHEPCTSNQNLCCGSPTACRRLSSCKVTFTDGLCITSTKLQNKGTTAHISLGPTSLIQA